MKFFIPQKEDEVQTNMVWQATKKFAEKTLNWKVSDRRIFSMAYKHNGRKEG